MKAVVNIGNRIVRISYPIKEIVVDRSQWAEQFKNYEVTQKTKKSKLICSHDLHFNEVDEWQSSLLFDGRIIDFHYDYTERKDFDNTKDWGNYIFQGYEYIEGVHQTYNNNEVKTVKIEY